jgi:hypothetical protein
MILLDCIQTREHQKSLLIVLSIGSRVSRIVDRSQVLKIQLGVNLGG